MFLKAIAAAISRTVVYDGWAMCFETTWGGRLNLGLQPVRSQSSIADISVYTINPTTV